MAAGTPCRVVFTGVSLNISYFSELYMLTKFPSLQDRQLIWTHSGSLRGASPFAEQTFPKDFTLLALSGQRITCIRGLTAHSNKSCTGPFMKTRTCSNAADLPGTQPTILWRRTHGHIPADQTAPLTNPSTWYLMSRLGPRMDGLQTALGINLGQMPEMAQEISTLVSLIEYIVSLGFLIPDNIFAI